MFKSISGGKLPERATKFSAGFDVFSNEDVVIGAGETKLIGLGISIDDDLYDYLYCYNERMEVNYDSDDCLSKVHYFKTNHYFALHIRSSLRAKGLTTLGTGIIDMDFVYPNEIKMIIHNPINRFGDFPILSDEYEIKKGDKIGQLILCRHEGWLLPSEYTKDDERTGGFGSSGE